MVVNKPNWIQRLMLNSMLSTFRMLGPIESLDWLAHYFDGYAEAMDHHGHPAPWCDDLVREVRAVVERAKQARAEFDGSWP